MTAENVPFEFAVFFLQSVCRFKNRESFHNHIKNISAIKDHAKSVVVYFGVVKLDIIIHLCRAATCQW